MKEQIAKTIIPFIKEKCLMDDQVVLVYDSDSDDDPRGREDEEDDL